MTTNFLYWILYYLKCGFNICYSYILNIINFNSNINTVNALENYSKLNENLYLIKLKGSYYNMGYNYGKIIPTSIIKKDLFTWFNYLKNNQNYLLRNLPEKYKRNNILDSLDILFKENKDYLNKDILNFIKGVSVSTNLSYEDLIKCNLIPDLIDNHCILLSKKINNKPFHLRTLDFGMPLCTQILFVLSPCNKHPYCFLSHGASYFGIVSGFSSKNIFFGESYYDNKLGQLSYTGMPFHQIAHHAFSSCDSLNKTVDEFRKMQKTSNLELLIANDDNSNILQCCFDYFKISQKLEHKDEVLSVTPNEYKTFKKNKRYLNSIENVFNKFITNTKSGELHIFIYYNDNIYISVTTSICQAYNNTFYKLNTKHLFYY